MRKLRLAEVMGLPEVHSQLVTKEHLLPLPRASGSDLHPSRD